jgi:hypothetical protein
MPSEHDLKGLMKFVERDEWHECFDEVLGAHFGAILETAEIDFEDLIDIVGGHWQGILWGCAFEDFLTLEFDIPGSNIVDEYLKRRSWREKPPAKAYMKALRHSVMSLYEVSDIVPGQSMKLRDLVRKNDPVLVHEHSATQSLNQWDRIAARVVEVRGKSVMCGGVLPFSFAASEALFSGLKEALNQDSLSKLNRLTDEQLREMAPLFTLIWLSDVMGAAAFTENPLISNSDGEEMVFHDIRFPFAIGVTQKQIAKQLNQHPQLKQENTKFWNWLETGSQAGKLVAGQENGLSLNTTLEDGSQVLGNIELSGKTLLFSVNSSSRSQLARELIEQTLGNLVRAPLTEIKTLNQMLAESSSDQRSEVEENIPPEIAEQIMQRTFDKHYRETLDQPIPALGNKTPRQAVKTNVGRGEVIEWLKYIENSSAKQGTRGGVKAVYDFSWMWEELGISRS